MGRRVNVIGVGMVQNENCRIADGCIGWRCEYLKAPTGPRLDTGHRIAGGRLCHIDALQLQSCAERGGCCIAICNPIQAQR